MLFCLFDLVSLLKLELLLLFEQRLQYFLYLIHKLNLALLSRDFLIVLA